MLNDLYKKTKLPIDDEFVDNILKAYFSISKDEMQSSFKEVEELIYSAINVDKKNYGTIIEEDKNDFLNDAFFDLSKRWNKQGVNPIIKMVGWKLFESKELTGKNLEHNKISHRLYIGANGSSKYAFCHKLYEKLKAANIPFYFKVNDNDNVNRRDNIVIYSSTEYLEETLKVVENILKENSYLLNNFSSPSILMGKLEDNIGYASEKANSGKSYTSKMIDIFYSSLKICIENIMKNNPNEILNYNGQKYTYKDFWNNTIKETFANKRVQIRQLSNYFFRNYPNLKKEFLNILKQKSVQDGIDINNACFNTLVKKEIEYFVKDTPKSNELNKNIDLLNVSNIDDQYYYILSGTKIGYSMDNVEELFNIGLPSYDNRLLTSETYLISQNEIDNMSLDKIIKNYVNNTGYLGASLLKIPKCFIDCKRFSDTFEAPIPLITENNGTKYLPGHFIEEIYDPSIDQFVKNPNYCPIFDVSGMKYSEEQMENIINMRHMEMLTFAQERQKASFNELLIFDKKQHTFDGSLKFYKEKLNIDQYQQMSENHNLHSTNKR